MKQFFKDLNTLHRFTLQLDLHRDVLKCKKCLKQDQFVSHGFIYKTNEDEKAGKRVICSNRYGRSGCGATFRLYLDSKFPTFQYTAYHLTIFFVSLMKGLKIQKAYQKATKTQDPRNAYRWLSKVEYKISDYRHFLQRRSEAFMTPFSSRPRRLQIILSTIKQLFLIAGQEAVAQYQRNRQSRFI